jgi:hypothetical protein
VEFFLENRSEKEQCFCQIPKRSMFIVVECKKWMLVSAESGNSFPPGVAPLRLSFFSPSSIKPS